MKSRLIMSCALAFAFLTPVMVDAQCAVCTDFGQPLSCKWGPYADGYKTCINIPGGCEFSGDCGIASILDLDGRVRLVPLTESYHMVNPTREVAVAASASQFASVVAPSDCKGRLLGADQSQSGRRTVNHIVI